LPIVSSRESAQYAVIRGLVVISAMLAVLVLILWSLIVIVMVLSRMSVLLGGSSTPTASSMVLHLSVARLSTFT
jgi:hypothetical protein